MYSTEALGSCRGEDLAIAGVVLSQNHLETALDTIHSAHSDAIGAPKVHQSIIFNFHEYENVSLDII